MASLQLWVHSSAFFQFPFRSIPLQFDSIEQERNGNGTELELDWNRNGAGLEQNCNNNGAGMKRERNGNGTEMEQKFNGRTKNAQFMVPSLLYDCIQAGCP